MPTWLALTCALAVFAAGVYLLLVILFPEKF